jgi:hypothetical protein
MLRPKLNLVIQDPASGRARPGAWVSVYRANTFTFAPLFADDDVTALGNPVQANNLGQVAVRVPLGVYDISATWDGSVPTVIEDVVAWAPGATPENPGEIIVGGPDGSIVILVPGTPGQVLTVQDTDPVSLGWSTLSPGHGLPTGPKGALLAYPEIDVLAPLLPGAQDQVLVMNSGVPTWGTALDLGIILPINQPGDLVAGDASGLPARLPRGATDQVLTVLASGLIGWGTGNLGSVITTEGDLIVGGPTGVATRLPKGDPGAMLHVSATGVVEWTPIPRTPSTLLNDPNNPASNPANTNENPLKSFTTEAGTPPGINDALRITANGTFGQKGTQKTIRVYYGSVLCLTIQTTSHGISWQCTVTITKQLAAQQGVHSTASVSNLPAAITDLVGTQDMTGPVLIRITGQDAGANPGHVTVLAWKIEQIPA